MGKETTDMKNKTTHGTTAWFEMVGMLLEYAAREAALPPDYAFRFVERYTDGADLGDGRVVGLRFEIAGGRSSFRVGVRPDERGDLTVEITAAGSRLLNTLYGSDPAYRPAIAGLKRAGELKVDGDFRHVGRWFHEVHDQIVERTR
jgi:hypothetical protein